MAPETASPVQAERPSAMWTHAPYKAGAHGGPRTHLPLSSVPSSAQHQRSSVFTEEGASAASASSAFPKGSVRRRGEGEAKPSSAVRVVTEAGAERVAGVGGVAGGAAAVDVGGVQVLMRDPTMTREFITTRTNSSGKVATVAAVQRTNSDYAKGAVATAAAIMAQPAGGTMRSPPRPPRCPPPPVGASGQQHGQTFSGASVAGDAGSNSVKKSTMDRGRSPRKTSLHTSGGGAAAAAAAAVGEIGGEAGVTIEVDAAGGAGGVNGGVHTQWSRNKLYEHNNATSRGVESPVDPVLTDDVVF